MTSPTPDLPSVDDWVQCPECDSDEVSVLFNNGRIIVTCESCYASASMLVKRAQFR